MTVSRSRSNWFIRIGCFLAGFVLIALAPYLWRTAHGIGAPVTAEPSRPWQIATVLVLILGGFLLYAASEYRNPWRRFRRFLNTDNVTLAIMTGVMLALGSFAYFVLNERLAAACWREPFAWFSLLRCPFYIVVTVLVWVVTAALGVFVYFGAVHHPILRAIGNGQRSPLADDIDEYP